jgi:2-oxoglutarate dehydrogenase E2 component (dihydrolipoamide succinyltransferase)
MALIEMVMPKMGESVMEGTILRWLKQVGDKIEQDESVLEVATDKVDTDVPATHAGILHQILVKEGDVVKVGSAIAVISTQSDSSDSPIPATVSAEVSPKTSTQILLADHQAQSSSNGDRFYSPLVKNIAKEEGISPEELSSIQGTGREGRVTKEDILSYLQNRSNQPVQAVSQAKIEVAPAQKIEFQPAAISVSGEHEIIEMDRMRKMIAERMVDSKRISPHVTSFVEADVTNLVRWRDINKSKFKAKEGQNLTFTPMFVEAIAKAIRDFPLINISVEGDKIIKKKDINIGMAVALPSGNLIVPVIRNADRYNLRGLALYVNDLAERARINKLKPDELQGGTYTVSNVGTFGNVMGTPIIMQPQVAIMALGAIRKKPAVIETPEGDLIGIRQMMFLSHSYDHRVVDGSLGGQFVRRVADYLENFDAKQSI